MASLMCPVLQSPEPAVQCSITLSVLVCATYTSSTSIHPMDSLGLGRGKQVLQGQLTTWLP